MKYKFNDGYEVEISERGTVQRLSPKKSDSIHASHFKAVAPGGRAAEQILKSGKKLEDYMIASQALTETVIRCGQGIQEAIAEITEMSARECEERNAKHAADQAALIECEKLACGFADPVQVSVDHFDGYPCAVKFNGREIRNPDWKLVYDGRVGFMERSALDSAIVALDAAAKLKSDSEARATAERNAEFASKATEARASGQPVKLSGWTTDRCMNGHGRDCSFDNAAKFVLPDGTTKTVFSCCY